jgi:hypothetical protein
MIFTPTVIQNTIPALAVTVADSGVPPVTYAQLKQSLGSYVYKVDGFYMFSDVFNQLIGAIKYQQYIANGNQDISSIVTTVDPYQDANAINVNLKDFGTDIILDGNSSLASTVLPNNYIQLSIFTRRITNSFGQNLNNFKDIEIASNKPNFFDNYGDLSNIKDTDQQVKLTTSLRSADGVTSAVVVQQPLEKNDNVPLVFLSLAAVSIGAYLFSKKLK